MRPDPDKSGHVQPKQTHFLGAKEPKVLDWRQKSCSRMLKSKGLVLVVLSFLTYQAFSLTEGPRRRAVVSTTGDQNRPQWAQYSPYFALDEYAEPDLPCRVTQVNILQRHGARYPTKSAVNRIKSVLQKLQSASATINDTTFAFLRNYTFDLGEDNLIPFGAEEALDSGALAFTRYGNLTDGSNIPFVRASGSDRVVESATNWTTGFSFASHQKVNPYVSAILSELPSFNNTLDDKMCPKATEPEEKIDIWEAIYTAPIIARFAKAVPGINLTAQDVTNLISLCPFETLAKETDSAICGLFLPEDFEGFEYYFDLEKFYGTGYGQELGRVQGVGYVNELIARLTNTPVKDETQTNRTLDNSPLTFPLNRSIYADFSHDNQMIAIYAALGIFSQPKPLDPCNPDPNRTWRLSNMVPFSGRLVTERLECKGKEYVRILVDDAVQDLKFCGSGNGLCELNKFVQSQVYSTNNGDGDFEKCF